MTPDQLALIERLIDSFPDELVEHVARSIFGVAYEGQPFAADRAWDAWNETGRTHMRKLAKRALAAERAWKKERQTQRARQRRPQATETKGSALD